MPNSAGSVYCLTLLTPISPGRAPTLRALLAALPRQNQSPFASLGSTHFVRWVVVDQLVYEGKPQIRDFLDAPHLLFTCVIDGDLDPFLDRLCTQQEALVDAVWGNCVDYDGARPPERFKAYVRRNQIDAEFFLGGYPQATLAEVQASIRLRGQVVDFVKGAQGLDAVALQRAFREAFSVGLPTPGHGGGK